jgi:uncharacterized membrane protein
MLYLVAGLVLFLGLHSVRIYADDWRTERIARMGPSAWKGLYAVASLLGFVLVVYGYGQSRAAPVDLWYPPQWTRYVTALLTLPVFILFAAAYIPGTHIKATIKHPMVAGVKIWAFAHLMSNGRLGDVVLFGAFLLWAALDYRSALQRDRKEGVTYPAIGMGRDVAAIAIGLVVWVVFAFWLHVLLIGVRPFG